MDKMANTYLFQGQASRFPHGQLKILSLTKILPLWTIGYGAPEIK